MDVIIVGDKGRADELKERLPAEATSLYTDDLPNSRYATEGLDKFDVIFDLNFDDDPSNLKYYAFHSDKPVIVGAVKRSLSKIVSDHNEDISCLLFGMNTLPTFINRPKAEISYMPSKTSFDTVAKNLGWEYLTVDDRVGMVTPRVIFMIINEACYTVEEGTANMQDIDLGMKLGTNYPYGPFEWADRIGVKDIYETLQALYEDTNDERYKICALLKRKYTNNEPFLN